MLGEGLQNKGLIGIFLCFFSGVLVAKGPGDVPEPMTYSAKGNNAALDLTIDGRLSESAWQNATRLALPYEWFPGDNTSSPVETECLIMFDEKFLYVGFRAYDPEPSKIRAFFADRDDAFQDDTVGIVIDPFHDKRRGFQFRSNPLGVQMDGVNSDVTDSEDWAWDAIWASAGQITETGYTVEFAIPFNQLRFPNASEPQSWGILAMRDYPRGVRHRLRSAYNDRALDCFVCQLETMEGFEGMEPGANLQITPTVTGGRTDRREEFPDGPFEKDDENNELGATIRWSVTPNSTFNAAINPDFSQVEADVAQLNVNERFALFFPERRPFFLEGADMFDTPMRVVFTRTVANPEAGLKYTSKQGKNAIGVFYARDRINNLIIPSNQGSSFTSIDEDVDSGVLRYRRDIGKNSNIGAILTHRGGGDYSSSLFGFDGKIRFSGSDSLEFQVLGTQTEYDAATAGEFDQEEGTLEDMAYEIFYFHSDRNWNWWAFHDSRGEDFRADFGFIPRVNVRSLEAGAQRQFYGGDDHWFRRLRINVSADYTEDLDGERAESGQDINFNYDGPLQSFVSLGIHPNEDYFDGVTYTNPRFSTFMRIRPTGTLTAELSVRWGKTIDFANSRQADTFTVEPTLTFKLGRRFEGVLRYEQQTLDVEGGELFTATLGQSNLIYHLNRRTFFRLITQYSNIERDPDLYLDTVDPEEEDLFNQFLFSYKVNPQTVILAGYSDLALGDQQVDLTRQERTFFLKLGYAWVR